MSLLITESNKGVASNCKEKYLHVLRASDKRNHFNEGLCWRAHVVLPGTLYLLVFVVCGCCVRVLSWVLCVGAFSVCGRWVMSGCRVIQSQYGVTVLEVGSLINFLYTVPWQSYVFKRLSLQVTLPVSIAAAYELSCY